MGTEREDTSTLPRMGHPWNEKIEESSITLEDVEYAREHIAVAPGAFVEIPVEYYDWLISRLKTARTEIRKAVDIMGGDANDGDTLVELVAVTEAGMHNALSLLDTGNKLVEAQGELIASQNVFIQTLRKGREKKDESKGRDNER